MINTTFASNEANWIRRLNQLLLSLSLANERLSKVVKEKIFRLHSAKLLFRIRLAFLSHLLILFFSPTGENDATDGQRKKENFLHDFQFAMKMFRVGSSSSLSVSCRKYTLDGQVHLMGVDPKKILRCTQTRKRSRWNTPKKSLKMVVAPIIKRTLKTKILLNLRKLSLW